jgi:hypothetical protein
MGHKEMYCEDVDWIYLAWCKGLEFVQLNLCFRQPIQRVPGSLPISTVAGLTAI